MVTTKISFIAQGTVEQTIRITKEGITPQNIISGLESGKYFTTLGDGKRITDSEDKEIAVIEDSEYELEYIEFESKDEEDYYVPVEQCES